ncbi:hypothetical protein D9757_003007 [Collybiopsis confluens]|uniref:Uncharacterized protein n=1 Tax=Collybiopsis confluens TaxID=2823264 RepID=A0A8H5MEK5_9AGAR|nr:hypothetical protein D9757_003007 [Collybiopsis confluens]
MDCSETPSQSYDPIIMPGGFNHNFQITHENIWIPKIRQSMEHSHTGSYRGSYPSLRNYISITSIATKQPAPVTPYILDEKLCTAFIADEVWLLAGELGAAMAVVVLEEDVETGEVEVGDDVEEVSDEVSLDVKGDAE